MKKKIKPTKIKKKEERAFIVIERIDDEFRIEIANLTKDQICFGSYSLNAFIIKKINHDLYHQHQC